jgi:hypothetical protein
MSNILKTYIREILTEEIVTVVRGNQNLTYDVQFDKEDNIKKSTKVDLTPDEEAVFDVVEKIASTVPRGTLLKKVRDLKVLGVSLQKIVKKGDGNKVVNMMNKYWVDTLEWPTPSRVGRGELQMKLQFASDPDAKEPDFVSSGGLALSIKYLGTGSGTAKTGEASVKIPELTEEFASVLGISKFPQSSWSGANLIAHAKTMNPSSKKKALQSAKIILDKIKQSIVGEHDADGILMLDSRNGFYLVDQSNYSDIQPVSIRNSGTRVEFTGPKLSPGITTLERAIAIALADNAADEAVNPKALSSRRRGRT